MITFMGSRTLMVPQSKSLSTVHQDVGFDLAVSGSVGRGMSPTSLPPSSAIFSSPSFLSPHHGSRCTCVS